MFYSPTARAAAFSIVAASLAFSVGCDSNPKSGGRTTASNGNATGTLAETTTDPEARRSQTASATGGSESQVMESLAYPTGDRKTSALLLEKMGAKQVRMGQPYEYQLKVTNLTDAPLGGVMISEQLGENFKISKAEPQAQQKDGMNVYNLGEIGPKESRTIAVTGTASAAGNLTSCTSVTYNPTLCSVAQVIAPQINLAKAGPARADICEDVVYKYTVSNTGTGDETNVTVTDQLPEGLKTADGKNLVQFVVDRVPQGKSREFEVRLRPDRTGDFKSAASASSAGGNVQSEEVATTVVAPELKVAVTGPEREYVGKSITYDISVQNTGQTAARNASLAFDGGGTGAQMVAVNNPQAAEGEARTASARIGGNGGDIGEIAAGQTRQYRVTVPAEKAGSVRVTAVAKAECAKDASAMATTSIETLPALLLEVVDREDLVRVGENVIYRITVTNQGTGPDTNVGITATLPPELQYVNAGGASGATAQGQQVKFTPVPSVAAGKAVEWNLEAKAIKAGDVRFQLDMNSDSLGKNVTETEATRLY
jgi:uncharacterized repeat protein (TIGR01451 family)